MYKDHPIINAEPYHRELYLLIMWMVVINQGGENDKAVRALEDLTIALGESCESMNQKCLNFDEKMLEEFIVIHKGKNESLYWVYDLLSVLLCCSDFLQVLEINTITQLLQYLEINSTILKIIFYYIEKVEENFKYNISLHNCLLNISNNYNNIILNKKIDLSMSKLENDTLYYNCIFSSKNKKVLDRGKKHFFSNLDKSEYCDVEIYQSDIMFLHCEFDVENIDILSSNNIVFFNSLIINQYQGILKISESNNIQLHKYFYSSLAIRDSSSFFIDKNLINGAISIQHSCMIDLVSNYFYSSNVENKVHNSNDISILKNKFTHYWGGKMKRIITENNTLVNMLKLGNYGPAYAMDIYQSKKIICTDNIIENCLEPGIYIDDDNANVTHSNNKCSNMYNESTEFNLENHPSNEQKYTGNTLLNSGLINKEVFNKTRKANF